MFEGRRASNSAACPKVQDALTDSDRSSALIRDTGGARVAKARAHAGSLLPDSDVTSEGGCGC